MGRQEGSWEEDEEQLMTCSCQRPPDLMLSDRVLIRNKSGFDCVDFVICEIFYKANNSLASPAVPSLHFLSYCNIFISFLPWLRYH